MAGTAVVAAQYHLLGDTHRGDEHAGPGRGMILAGVEFRTSPMELRHASTGRPTFVVVPLRRLMAVDGVGRRGAEDFRRATVLLRAAYEALATSLPRDPLHLEPHPIAEITWPLDGVPTVDHVVEALDDPHQYWRQMIEIPARASMDAAVDAIDAARAGAHRKLPLVHVMELDEGPAVQILETGDEGGSEGVRKLMRFVREARLAIRGDLHELVLADAAVVGHDRARSILRMPVGPG